MSLLDLFRTNRKARVDETKAVIAETEQVKKQLHQLTQELAVYVADLRAMTHPVVLRKIEGTARNG